MGLFSDIYNTVARFFRPQEEQGDASKSVAASRLKLVLMQDRTNLTPKILEQMRGELIDLLSRYVELDKELLELDFQQEGDQVALMLSIPVIRAKDEEEIEAALAGVNEEAGVNEGTEEEVDEQSGSEDEAADETDNEVQTVTTPEEMAASKKDEEVKEEGQSEA